MVLTKFPPAIHICSLARTCSTTLMRELSKPSKDTIILYRTVSVGWWAHLQLEWLQQMLQMHLTHPKLIRADMKSKNSNQIIESSFFCKIKNCISLVLQCNASTVIKENDFPSKAYLNVGWL